MIDIKVELDVSGPLAQLAALKNQIPFAIASALTKTAQDVQAEVRRQMPRRFTVRTPWIAKGVRVKPSTKANLTAIVHDVDPFMNVQESGGEKKSIRRRVFDYGPYLAVPLDARRNPRDVVRKEDWPANLIKPFILTAADGRKYLAVHALAKKLRGQRGKLGIGKQVGGTGVRLMYRLVEQADIKPRFGFTETARRVIAQKFAPNLEAAMQRAIATAR